MANETGNVVKMKLNLPVAGMFEQDAQQGFREHGSARPCSSILKNLGTAIAASK